MVRPVGMGTEVSDEMWSCLSIIQHRELNLTA